MNTVKVNGARIVRVPDPSWYTSGREAVTGASVWPAKNFVRAASSPAPVVATRPPGAPVEPPVSVSLRLQGMAFRANTLPRGRLRLLAKRQNNEPISHRPGKKTTQRPMIPVIRAPQTKGG